MIFRSPLIWFFEFHVYKVTNWICALGVNLPKIWSHIESTTVWQIRFDILMILNTLEYTLLFMENQRNVLYKCLINNLCDFRSYWCVHMNNSSIQFNSLWMLTWLNNFHHSNPHTQNAKFTHIWYICLCMCSSIRDL